MKKDQVQVGGTYTAKVSGGVVPDSSGHGLDGTLVNGATAQVTAGDGGGSALVLPGGAPASDGAYVKIPRPALSGATMREPCVLFVPDRGMTGISRGMLSLPR